MKRARALWLFLALIDAVGCCCPFRLKEPCVSGVSLKSKRFWQSLREKTVGGGTLSRASLNRDEMRLRTLAAESA